jgi:hypothetical protein
MFVGKGIGLLIITCHPENKFLYPDKALTYLGGTLY